MPQAIDKSSPPQVTICEARSPIARPKNPAIRPEQRQEDDEIGEAMEIAAIRRIASRRAGGGGRAPRRDALDLARTNGGPRPQPRIMWMSSTWIEPRLRK